MLEIKLKTNLSDLEDLTSEFPEASREARIARITEALNLLEREIKQRTPWGAGPIHLRDTIYPSGPHVQGNNVWGSIGTPLEHGEPVEYGTRPHFPPIAPIQFWVEKKLGLAGAEARSAAFLIARTISVHGTKGAHMFEKGFEAAESRVIRILENIPDDIVRKTL
ncbi:hypothetical protein KKE60_07745 [Patescibacteria group bacterium]|nr:hypothetical protein [Patescibacteria group bacterium]